MPATSKVIATTPAQPGSTKATNTMTIIVLGPIVGTGEITHVFNSSNDYHQFPSFKDDGRKPPRYVEMHCGACETEVTPRPSKSCKHFKLTKPIASTTGTTETTMTETTDTTEPDEIQFDANGLIKMPKDRFFNPWRMAAGENLLAVVKEAQVMITTYESHYKLRVRARKPTDQKVFEETVEAVICEMMYGHLTLDDRGSAISLSNQDLGRRSRYRPSSFSKALSHILTCMAAPEVGLITLQKGCQKALGNRGQRTLIWPAWRTLARIEEHDIQLEEIGRRKSEETIVLKAKKYGFWDDGSYLEYPDTDQTRKMREEVAEVNQWLTEADIEVDRSGLLVDRPIQTTDRRLRRIFTRGSFESGGRLFGGFWQPMRGDERREAISIQGERVVGLDYGQVAPRIAYGLTGVTPVQEDLYQIDGIPQGYRAGMKRLMNALLSCDGPMTRKPKGLKDILPPQPIGDLVKLFSNAHRPIAHLFCTGICHRIQFVESAIMLGVLQRLRTQGVVALPIHDGLLVAESAMDVAKKVMEEVAEQVAGILIPVSVE